MLFTNLRLQQNYINYYICHKLLRINYKNDTIY